MNNESVILSNIHSNFANNFIKEKAGPYSEHLQVVYIIKGIYCIMFKKGVLRNGGELNYTNNKTKLAYEFSNACHELGLKHCVRYQVDGYNGIYLYLNTWDSNRDIKQAKEYASRKRAAAAVGYPEAESWEEVQGMMEHDDYFHNKD